ncbi:hypothetical protein [Streptomyces roseoverticillatus]|uniref:hypothetical protein n=1 Tax=Streptomyces roseoverticillatus TaxID=66429 RepID=UPI0004C087BF|nr:hypothetical protein [Streptomyces roseoverticillatus]
MADHPDPLVVPVDVEALVVSRPVVGHTFYRAPLFFQQKKRKDPQQDPFSNTAPGLGVYVHWQLPDALCAGRMRAGDRAAAAPVHPPAPNRWLVVRHFRPSGDTVGKPVVTGWVIESDYTSTRQKTPASDGATSPFGHECYIGRRHDLAKAPWQEDPRAPRVRLTSMGPGIPEFAAYQPYNADVFSLHDLATGRGDASSPGSLPDGSIDYLVVGWHSAAEDDPLHQGQATDLLEFYFGAEDQDSAAWQQLAGASDRYTQLLNLLQWQAPDASVRERSLYVGSVVGLRWGADLPLPSRRPTDSAATKIAVGHGPADAMAALVKDCVEDRKSTSGQWQGKALQDAMLLLNAFQTGELETLDTAMDDGVRALDAAVHRTGFHAGHGGYAWQAAPPVDPDAGPEQLRLTQHEQATLAELNQRQERLDRAERKEAELRRHLYDLWWMSGLGQPPKDFAAQCARALDPAGTGTVARRAKDAAEATRSAAGAVRELLTGGEKTRPKWLRKGWTLTRVPRPSFFEAADPVLLVRGAGLEKELSPAAEKPLPCRLPRQLIDKITVKGTDITGKAAPEPPNFAALRQALETPTTRLPFSALQKLLTEFTVISETAAGFGNASKSVLPRARRALDTVMAEHNAVIPEAAAWPARTFLWQQPWQPLHLHWQVDYYPLPHGKEHWKLDGVEHHQTEKHRPARLKEVAKGKVLLSSVPLFTWHKRIKDHHSTYPDAPSKELNALNDRVAGWDLLSQSLDGLHAWCTQRRRGSGGDPLPAHKDLNPLLGVPNIAVPDPRGRDSRFQPVCAGQLTLTRLAVSDRFGHAFDIIRPGDEQDALSLIPRRSPGMTPRYPAESDNAHRFIQRSPRLAQPARLRLDFLPHRSTAPTPVLDVHTDPALTEDTPVCGWLLAHSTPHAMATRSLLVHGPHGQGLGEVRLIGPTGKPEQQAVGWLPLPGSPWLTPADVLSAGFAVEYPHLAGFLRDLIDKDADRRAGRSLPSGERVKPHRFRELLAAIDRGLHTVAPPVGDRDRTLCVLAGRPLALVRARVGLELDGPPLANPREDGWKAALKTPEPGDGHPLWTSAWPVVLGAGWDLRDGLIGYYATVGDLPRAIPSYTHLHVVHKPPKASTWLKWIDDDPLTVLARWAPMATSEDTDPLTAAYPTLLMDPFASVGAYTGILPTGSLRLPPALVTEVLARLRIGIPAGPVLLTTRPAPPELPDSTPASAVLPVPAGRPGTWSWGERTAPEHLPLPQPWLPPAWTERPVEAADALVAYGDSPPVATSGYLTHTPPAPAKRHSTPQQEPRP